MAKTRTRTLLKDLTPTIQQILTEKEKSRDDDWLLYLYFLNSQGISKNISVGELYKKIKIKELPTIESVGRIRRKIQELYPNLAPSLISQQSRNTQREEYKEYSKDLTRGYKGL